ncbi:class I SAM-dependent methyltransferase [Paenibacillus arenilitoris]|uniref:Class I SAM-dependent methyltransferase n=1 Tax=Paenibacillus arenilitoris TaxID=2772299 RepID=A0A927CL23_9BACL|nr:class I SAM-dependent methyltransferase [Paenibacillus arenilitoris]MBD2868762.1 class I SAM-dependent methyltransferase [Paenibacillus arenilitoris]
MKLDLGCGDRKQPGFHGMNDRPLAGVDVVGSLNERLPFPDDAAEFVMAVRSLPYVRDLFAVLSEVYRVCAHKAVVCILAPYAHSFRHRSNPHFNHLFDEHTPRHLTSCFFQPSLGQLSPEITPYEGPPPPFDFRLLRMEMFYLPPFRSPLFEEEELEILQQLQLNVVDEVMYHFLVVKESIAGDELDRLSRLTMTEPDCVKELRRSAGEEGDVHDGGSD